MAAERKSLGRIFKWPVVVGFAGVVGLLAGLLGNGAWDLLSGTALSVPLILWIWFSLAARRQ